MGGTFTPIADKLLGLVSWPERWDRAWAVGLLAAFLILILTFVAGWLLRHVITGALRKIAARTSTDLDDKILDLAERPAYRLVQMIGVYLAAVELPFPAPVETTLTGVLLIMVVFVAVRVAVQISILLLLAYGRSVNDDVGKERFEKDYVPLLSKILGTVWVLVGLIMVLHHFGQDVSSVVAALGIGGLAISFAAKDTLGNMFAGFTILMDRPFRPGDRIRLASGEVGDVIEVGTRSTRVKLLDHNMLIVPNAELVNTRVVNFNFPTHATRATLEVGVAYGCDVELAKRLVVEAITSQPEVVKEPPPTVVLSSFGDSALMVSGYYVISEFANATAAQDRVRVRVYEAFQKADIKIPYPTRELILSGQPVLPAPPTG